MIAAVADTHTAFWHLFDDARLSRAAGAFIREAATTRRKIAISTISLAELVYLIEKNGKNILDKSSAFCYAVSIVEATT